MTLDISEFSAAAARAQEMLLGLSAGGDALDGALKRLEASAGGCAAGVAAAFDALGSAPADMTALLPDVSGIGSGLIDALTGLCADASSAGQLLAASAANGLDASGLLSRFSSAGDNAGSAFVTALRSHISAAASAATAIGSAAYNALKASLSIHSPSKKMRELGAYTGEGYAIGISDTITMAEKSIASLAGATVSAASAGGVTNNNSNFSINLNNASIRSDDDIRRLSRQLGRVITDSTYGR